MTPIEWMAVSAVVLAAVSVLPGTLGILIYTHKVAASGPGARFIFGNAIYVLIASAGLMGAALYQAMPIEFLSRSLVEWGAGFTYGGILVYGFLMHVALNFRPIRDPIFITAAQALEKYGPDEEVVGVIDQGGKPYGFIARLSRRPHIVYQPEGAHPFIMTHCILAHSSMSYATQGDFADPDIRVSAVLANNAVFYDKKNACSIIQIEDRRKEKDLPLVKVSTLMTSLKTWTDLYPDSPIWMREIAWRDVFYLKLLARADIIDPSSPVMIYPLQHDLDERQPMKSQVIGVRAGGANRAYPVSLFKGRMLIEDSLGGADLLIAAVGDYIQVFDRKVDGATLTFTASQTAGRFTDTQTGSEWSIKGECVSGANQGKRLDPIPHYNKMFWYVWADFFPGTPIYGAEEAARSEAARSEAARSEAAE